MKRRLFLWAGGLTLCPVSRTHAGTGFQATPFGRKTECQLSLKEKTLSLTILSPSGIGRLELSRDPKKQNAWPETIELLISQTKGHGLKELEGLVLRTSSSLIEGSRRTSGKMELFKIHDGKRKEPAAKMVDVKVAKTATAMRITFAGALLAEATKVTAQWVDFYR